MTEQRVWVHADIGPITITGSSALGLCGVHFARALAPGLASMDPLLVSVEDELKAFLEGKLTRFSKFPFNLQGTAFQQQVWSTLQSIPYGQTRSYRWMAEQINVPKGMRAVGNANGKNPIAIIIPCHRVIQHNGQLGGYAGGVGVKQFLLRLEQRSHHNALFTAFQGLIPALA